jgi:hypothetical protein
VENLAHFTSELLGIEEKLKQKIPILLLKYSILFSGETNWAKKIGNKIIKLRENYPAFFRHQTRDMRHKITSTNGDQI